MDHHCPWIDNCVGYLTMKPFLLFLFWVTCLCFYAGYTAYKIAWEHNLGHISLGLAYLPSLGGKEYFVTYFMTDDQKKARTEQNRRDFMEQVWLEGNSTGSFEDEMKIFWNMLKPGRDSMWYSRENWF